ncbi:hypothetical protein EDD85DRAFT_519099 [Armillaria nabsnona]|nr:hypothetical protein EDD85DRAFT_519099 [Armillaria nabsnona]
MISDSEKRIDTIVLELKVMKQELLQAITRVDKELAELDKERKRLRLTGFKNDGFFSALCVVCRKKSLLTSSFTPSVPFLSQEYSPRGPCFLSLEAHSYHLNWCPVTGRTILTHSPICGLMLISSSIEHLLVHTSASLETSCPALGSAHYRSRYAAVPTAPHQSGCLSCFYLNGPLHSQPHGTNPPSLPPSIFSQSTRTSSFLV